MDRFIWLLKQLLPLTYRTTFRRGDRKFFTVWQMWFGRSFNVTEVAVDESVI